MATPRVLFALETARASYHLVVHPDGWIRQTHGRQGPLLEIGPRQLFEADEILRHLADEFPAALWPRSEEGRREATRWLETAWRQVRPAVRRLAAGDASARDELNATLDALEQALVARDWLAGEPSVADMALLHVGMFDRLGVSLGGRARVQAWSARLHAHPALARARARLAEVAS